MALGIGLFSTITVGVDCTWLYPFLLAFVPVVGVLVAMKRRA